MSMYNLLEYTHNYSMTSESLWNYYRDEVNDENMNETNDDNYRASNENTPESKSLEYKTKIIESIPIKNNLSLNYLCNFWRYLDSPLINCEIELDLSWSKIV